MAKIQAEKIKQLRKAKGYSQEKLAQESGLGLRTIQRIEKGDSQARGETLNLLANALNVPLTNLLEEKTTIKTADNYSGYLLALHLSPLSILLFPFLNVLVPWVLWTSKRKKSEKVNQEGKKVLNFQLTLALIFILIFLGSIISLMLRMKNWEVDSFGAGGLIAGTVGPMDIFFYLYVFGAFLYAYLICFAVVNAIKSSKQKKTKYFPAIRFLKS